MSARCSLVFLAVILAFAINGSAGSAQNGDTAEGESKTLRVLFIGNSYTARHNLALVVKSMAEAGQAGLSFQPTTVIYGGRTLADHWRLGTQNYVKLHSLTREDEESTIATLMRLTKDPKDRYAGAALRNHQSLLSDWDAPRKPWDIVVLQSYRDDLEGSESLYAQYAPKFASLAKAQGARVVLYVTTPTTQNAQPLKTDPESAAVMNKARSIAALADEIGADAAPMSLVGLRCQTERPDLTLRFVNDAHLNQTMAYLTACTLYSTIFDQSPQGLPVDSITDIRFWENKDRSKDRDGKPIKQVFSAEDVADLQRIAWEGYGEFKKLRSQVGSPSR